MFDTEWMIAGDNAATVSNDLGLFSFKIRRKKAGVCCRDKKQLSPVKIKLQIRFKTAVFYQLPDF